MTKDKLNVEQAAFALDETVGELLGSFEVLQDVEKQLSSIAHSMDRLQKPEDHSRFFEKRLGEMRMMAQLMRHTIKDLRTKEEELVTWSTYLISNSIPDPLQIPEV